MPDKNIDRINWKDVPKTKYNLRISELCLGTMKASGNYDDLIIDAIDNLISAVSNLEVEISNLKNDLEKEKAMRNKDGESLSKRITCLDNLVNTYHRIW